jgi:hypothetical protein
MRSFALDLLPSRDSSESGARCRMGEEQSDG